jgi:hypothetical protein
MSGFNLKSFMNNISMIKIVDKTDIKKIKQLFEQKKKMKEFDIWNQFIDENNQNSKQYILFDILGLIKIDDELMDFLLNMRSEFNSLKLAKYNDTRQKFIGQIFKKLKEAHKFDLFQESQEECIKYFKEIFDNAVKQTEAKELYC